MKRTKVIMHYALYYFLTSRAMIRSCMYREQRGLMTYYTKKVRILWFQYKSTNPTQRASWVGFVILYWIHKFLTCFVARRASRQISTWSTIYEEEDEQHCSSAESKDEEDNKKTSESEVEALLGQRLEIDKNLLNMRGSYKNVIYDVRGVLMNYPQRTCRRSYHATSSCVYAVVWAHVHSHCTVTVYGPILKLGDKHETSSIVCPSRRPYI